MKDLSGMMKQAQKLQAKMMAMQEELGNRTVSAQAGGGMVEAVVNGRQELLTLRIDPEVVVAEDVEMLQDLILAAHQRSPEPVPGDDGRGDEQTHRRHADSGVVLKQRLAVS